MKLDYSKTLQPRWIKCSSPQSNEVNAITADFLEFCRLLKESGNNEVVPLSEFAKWRVEEGVSEEPIPSIN